MSLRKGIGRSRVFNEAILTNAFLDILLESVCFMISESDCREQDQLSRR